MGKPWTKKNAKSKRRFRQCPNTSFIVLTHYSNIPLFHSSCSFFLFTPLEDPSNLLPSLDETGEQGNLSFQEEHHTGKEVCEKVFAPQLIVDEHGRLMDPTSSFYTLDERLVEEMDVFLPRRDFFFDGHFS